VLRSRSGGAASGAASGLLLITVKRCNCCFVLLIQLGRAGKEEKEVGMTEEGVVGFMSDILIELIMVVLVFLSQEVINCRIASH
jgi:hypothetical protein